MSVVFFVCGGCGWRTLASHLLGSVVCIRCGNSMPRVKGRSKRPASCLDCGKRVVGQAKYCTRCMKVENSSKYKHQLRCLDCEQYFVRRPVKGHVSRICPRCTTKRKVVA